MTARPGKTLPSVIVGGLLVSTLALGMGTAHAGDNDPVSPLDPITSAVDPLLDAQCLLSGEPVLMGTKYVRQSGSTNCEPVRVTTQVIPPVVTEDSSANTPSAGGARPVNQGSDGSVASDQTPARSPVVVRAPAPVYVPAPAPVVAPAPAAGLLTPSSFGAAPGGLLTGLPATSGFGAYNPGLLLAPAGSPLRTLTGQDAGSPVTTASQVQALALDGLPGGLGTPAVLGVLILSTLGAFALRHAVLRRARAADAETTDDAKTTETAGV